MSHLISVNLRSTVFDEKRIDSGSLGQRWWMASLTVVLQEDPEGKEYEGAPFESWGETQDKALEELTLRLEKTLEEVRKIRSELKEK